MKTILVSFLVLSQIISCNAQQDRMINEELVDVLKKDKFNLEIYELSFCLDEILYLIENDSNYFKTWKERVNKSFDPKLKKEVLYIHSLEYDFFKLMILENSALINFYPNAYKKIQEIKPTPIAITNSKFSEVFKAYIEFPEQVDDICMVMLVCKLNCATFNDVQNDKIALWKFTNWIDYGFEEFRYYPGTLNEWKGIINKRIINYILKSNNCVDHPLVSRSIALFNSMIEKYH